jgi:hypothetical protein
VLYTFGAREFDLVMKGVYLVKGYYTYGVLGRVKRYGIPLQVGSPREIVRNAD